MDSDKRFHFTRTAGQGQFHIREEGNGDCLAHCDTEANAKLIIDALNGIPAVGSWAWALEQMEAGKTVARDGIHLREQFPGGGYYFAVVSEGDGSWFWQPTSTDFTAGDWRLSEETESGDDQ